MEGAFQATSQAAVSGALECAAVSEAKAALQAAAQGAAQTPAAPGNELKSCFWWDIAVSPAPGAMQAGRPLNPMHGGRTGSIRIQPLFICYIASRPHGNTCSRPHYFQSHCLVTETSPLLSTLYEPACYQLQTIRPQGATATLATHLLSPLSLGYTDRIASKGLCYVCVYLCVTARVCGRCMHSVPAAQND